MQEIKDIEKWLEKHDINDYIVSKDLYVTVYGNVNLNDRLKEDVLPVKFKLVDGYFDISSNSLLSLEGCPDIVTKDFNCSNNKLNSLFNAPNEVGDFDCSHNELQTLSYAPKKVSGYFNCSYNNITSLNGSPRTVKGYFNCSNNKISTLKRAPETVGLTFDCSFNLLDSLNGGPTRVGQDYICVNNSSLVDLQHIATEIGWNLITNIRLNHVDNTYDKEKRSFKYKGEEAVEHLHKPVVKIQDIGEIRKWLEEHKIKKFTILENCSVDIHENVKLSGSLGKLVKLPIQFNEINGDFDISDNTLNSLEGCPNKVKGDFLAYKNELTSLKGAPKEVKGSFIVLHNNIINLKYSPSIVKEDFICSHNPLKNLEGINTVLGHIFTGVHISKIEHQKYVYNGVSTYKYLGENIMKYLDTEYVSLTEEEQVFENTRKNMERVVLKLLNSGELTAEKINKTILDNLKKYRLIGLRDRLLLIKYPSKEEKSHLSEKDIIESIFDEEL